MRILAWLKNRLGYGDQKELVEKLVKQELEDPGRENYSPDGLTLNDLAVRFEPDVLGDHLPVFGSPDEIIRINRDHPEYLHARRIDSEGSTCSTDSCPRKAGSKKQEEEDK